MDLGPRPLSALTLSRRILGGTLTVAFRPTLTVAFRPTLTVAFRLE